MHLYDENLVFSGSCLETGESICHGVYAGHNSEETVWPQKFLLFSLTSTGVLVMSTTPPPSGDPSLQKGEGTGERTSVALSEGGSSSARSSLSISGPQWPLPDDFDIKRYETESALAKVIQIQSFLRQVSVQQHYNLIGMFEKRFSSAMVDIGL